MLNDRPPDAVVGQLEGRAAGAGELPGEQIIERIPGEPAISARRGSRRLCLEVPWHQNLEGVEACVEQEVEDRQLRQLRLLCLHARDAFAMCQAKQVKHAAQLGHGFAFRRGLVQFSSSWGVRVKNEPGVSDRTDQRVRRLARHAGHESLSSDRLLADVSRHSEHHGLGMPRLCWAVLHYVAGPEEAVALLLRGLLLADRQRLSVQIGSGDSLDGDR